MNGTLEVKKTDRAASRVKYVIPAVDIREEKDAYILEADMPGVNKDSLEITLEGSELTLVGHRSQSSVAGEVLLREQAQADYRRVFEVDPAIASQGIMANLVQGRLTLTLPKSERSKPRRIKVNG